MNAPVPALILTRPDAASRRFRDSLDPAILAQVPVIIAPVLEIVPLGGVLPETVLRGAAGLVFTSSNAVDIAAHAIPNNDLPCFCIGAVTTARARGAGWRAERAGNDADSLVSALLSRQPEGPLVHLHGAHTRGDVAGRLSAAGLACTGQAIYDQRAVPLSAAALARLAGPGAVLPVFSPRSAALLLAALPPGAQADIAALSPAVADVFAGRPGLSVRISARPDADAMRGLVENLLIGSCRVEGGGTAH